MHGIFFFQPQAWKTSQELVIPNFKNKEHNELYRETRKHLEGWMDESAGKFAHTTSWHEQTHNELLGYW